MQRLQEFPGAMPRSYRHGFAGLRSLCLLACLGTALASPAYATNTAGAAVFDAHAVDPLAGTARQEQVASAMDAEGRSVTVWLDRRGTSAHLRLQRHDAAGLPYGEPIQVNNTAIVGSYAYPQVAMSADGAFTVVWTQMEPWLGGMPHVFRRSFNRHGQPLMMEQRVDPPGTPEAGSAQVAMRSDGSHSIAWLSYPGSGQRALYLAGFDANGLSLGVPQLVASGTSSTQLTWPRLAMDDAGNTLAVWSEDRNGAMEEVWMRRRFANGTFGAIARVNSLAPATVPRPDLAMDAAGNAVVVWRQYHRTMGLRIVGQRLLPSGVLAGSEFLLAAREPYPKDEPAHPNVAMARQTGDFAAVWRRADSHIYVRHFHANGTPLGPERPSSQGGARTDYPDVAMDADGDTQVAWQSVVPAQSYTHAFQRRFAGLAPLDVRARLQHIARNESPSGVRLHEVELRGALIHAANTSGRGVASGIIALIETTDALVPQMIASDGWVCSPAPAYALSCAYLPSLWPLGTALDPETPTKPLRLQLNVPAELAQTELRVRIGVNQFDASALNDQVSLQLQ
ncbi:hypothetical protein [Lysobacter brunescens]|uniref:Uncharacterized protein n=1 Tax=Lysobacter brunescens TaxID=262323 RepID=A0ABW2Y754_9GAMM